MGLKSGLSLLETLVSLVLMSILAVGLSASLGLSIRTFDRVSENATLTEELALRAQLRNWLGTAAPPQRLTRIETGFVGRSNRLQFVTFASSGFSTNAAALSVTLELNQDMLLMTVETIDDTGAAMASYRRRLAQNLANPSITYFDSASKPPNWVPEWTDANRLPELVRISADVGSVPEWTEFTVRLQYAL